ncbi:MAG: beta-glycosidase [Muribaculaceae bacterium]|nr:beta-glycosidase [Muribaculaceae bacterium]
MKIFKYILFAAAGLAMVACSDEPQGVSTKVPVDTPDPEPVLSPDDDVTSPRPTFACDPQTVAANASQQFQAIEGFGASDCWLPNTIGQYWSDNRQLIANYLFSQNKSNGQPEGIGLSVWRVNLGGGSAEQGDESGIVNINNRAESFLSGGSYNWGKCAGQQYFMEQAKRFGCESFVLFVNSPLVQYTRNGKAFSKAGGTGNLKEENYEAYANYLVNVAEHFNAAGYNVTHISPLNEPQFDWDGDAQEGSGWDNTHIANYARALDKVFQASGTKTKLSFAEAASYEDLYSGDDARRQVIKHLFTKGSPNYIGDLKSVDNHVAAHSYWTYDTWDWMRTVRQKARQAADAQGLRLWQTEWSMLGDAPSELAGGNYDMATEMDIALYMSKIIHNDLTVANVTSWSYWTAMSVERYGQKNRFELIKTTAKGGENSDDFTQGGSVVATDNLWVLGNYSLFVRPGYVRVGLQHQETKDFFGSAWMAPDGSKLVVVYTNMNKNKGVLLDSSFGGLDPKIIQVYTTTEKKHLKYARFNPKDKVFLDPASVTTVVYTL